MTIERQCENCGKKFNPSDCFPSRLKRKNYARFCSVKCHNKSMLGVVRSDSFKESCRIGQTGRKHSKKSRLVRSKKMKKRYQLGLMPDQSGENNPNWRGGYCWYNPIRSSARYKRFRAKVLKRDGHKCVLCGSKQRLEVDHIKSFKKHPRYRFSLKNARSLCRECHKKTLNYGNRITS